MSSSRSVEAKITLLVTQNVCKNVRIVDREMDELELLTPQETDFFRKGVIEGKEAPWLWADPDTGIIYGRWIEWDNGELLLDIGPGIIGEVLILLQSLEQALENGFPEFEKALIAFYTKCGPIIDSPTNGHWLVILRAYLIITFRLLKFYGSTLPLTPRMPPPFSRGETYLEEIHGRYQLDQNFLTEIGHSLEELITVLPDIHSSLLFLPAPPEPFESREEGIKWMKDNVAFPILNRVLQGHLYTYHFNNEKGELKAILIPKNLFALSLLALFNLTQLMQERPLCLCGCKLEIPPGRKKWYNDEHKRRGLVKQKILAYYRTRKNRGNYTKDEYENIKKLVNKLWSQGFRNKSDVIEIVNEQLGQKR